MGASAYARVILGLDGAAVGSAPAVDLATEKRNAEFVRGLIRGGLVHAVHDVSEGGVACAAAEMALASGRGLFLSLDEIQRSWGGPAPLDLFEESQGRYLLSVKEADQNKVYALRDAAGVEASWAGRTNDAGSVAVIEHVATDRKVLELPLSTLRAAHEGWLPKYMSGEG
jgi:phosphoribosylformylglycinamidine synthase